MTRLPEEKPIWEIAPTGEQIQAKLRAAAEDATLPNGKKGKP